MLLKVLVIVLVKILVSEERGDSRYPLEPWLMTPFLNPQQGSVEEPYNYMHASTRVCVERCYH